MYILVISMRVLTLRQSSNTKSNRNKLFKGRCTFNARRLFFCSDFSLHMQQLTTIISSIFRHHLNSNMQWHYLICRIVIFLHSSFRQRRAAIVLSENFLTGSSALV
jgi:hypothetical protein